MRINAGDRDERAAIIAEIAEKTGAELVQTIGHIAVFYLPNSEKQEDPAARLVAITKVQCILTRSALPEFPGGAGPSGINHSLIAFDLPIRRAQWEN